MAEITKVISFLLRSLLQEFERPNTTVESGENVHAWERRKRKAYKKLKPLLAPENIDKLTEADVSDLLNFDKNQTMDLRFASRPLVKNMEKFKEAIKILTDERRDIKERLNEVLEPGKAPGVGHVTAPLILSIHNPKKYPIWSNPKKKILKNIGVIDIDNLRGTFGHKYVQIIEAEKELCRVLKADHLKLDIFLWWLYDKKIPPD